MFALSITAFQAPKSLTREVILDMADLIEARDITLRRPPVAAAPDEVSEVQHIVLDHEDRLDHEAADP